MNKQSIILLFLISSYLALSSAEWGYIEENDVVSLTKATHNNFLKDYEYAVISYMSPNCKTCKDMKVWFHDLALDFKEYETKLPVAMLNCEKYPDFCGQLLIPVFPEIRFYIKEHPISYNGPRNVKYLEKWIKEKLAHTPYELKTKDDV